MANTPQLDPSWPLVVVIEGAACSGKTKLAALVHEGARAMELKSQIHHLEEPFSAKACIKKLTTGLPDGEVAILDGFHFSAAAALRRRPFTFRDDVLAIERLLSSMQAIKVELTASESVFERRLIDAAPDARRRFERWVSTWNLLRRFELIDELTVQEYLLLQNNSLIELLEISAGICRAIGMLRQP